MANGDAIELELEDKAWEVASVSPVATANGGSTLWAPFGLLDMLNGGGAVSSSRLSMGLGTRFSAVAKVQLRATGDFGAYCEPRPHRVKLDGRSVAFGYDEVRRIARSRGCAAPEPRPSPRCVGVAALSATPRALRLTCARGCSPLDRVPGERASASAHGADRGGRHPRGRVPAGRRTRWLGGA